MSVRSYREVQPPKWADTPTMAVWLCLDWLEANSVDGGIYNALGDGGNGTVEVSRDDLQMLAEALRDGTAETWEGVCPANAIELAEEVEADIKATVGATHITYHCY